MHLRELRDRVFTTVRDLSREFVTNDDVDDWLNEGYFDLNARLRFLRQEATGTVTGNLTLPTSPRVLSVLSLRLGSDDVEFVDEDVWNSYLDAGATAAHSIAYVFEGDIYIYPSPAGASYTLRYVREPTILSADTDEPELPAHLQVRLIRYAQAHAFLKLDQPNEFTAYLALYEEGLPAPPGVVKPINPGPLVVSYEKGPFDLIPESRHW